MQGGVCNCLSLSAPLVIFRLRGGGTLLRLLKNASLLNMFANALKIFVERLLVLVVNDVQQVFQLVADF